MSAGRYRHPHPEDMWEERTQPYRQGRQVKPKATVEIRDGRKWITYSDEIVKGRKRIPVVVEMPDNALTKSCYDGRHHQCNHGRGGAHELGVVLKISKPSFTWCCGCPCHRSPDDIGMLF